MYIRKNFKQEELLRLSNIFNLYSEVLGDNFNNSDISKVDEYNFKF
jgi:hypothetical protein